MTPAQVAEQGCAAVRERKLYVLTTPAYDEAIRSRTQAILARSNPRFPDLMRSVEREIGSVPR